MKARASDSALSTSRTATTVREPLYRQLKPGPGLSAEAVVTNQRARLFGAMVEMVADGGYGSVKVREISRLAGVSTRTFYDRFANVEDCFACTYSWILGEALMRANAVGSGRPEALRDRLQAFLGTFEEHPKAAHLVLLEACSAGPAAMARERAGIQALEGLIREDLCDQPVHVPPLPHVVRGIAAATMRVARSRLLAARATDVAEDVEELSAWAQALRCESAALLPDAARPGDERKPDSPRPPEPIGDERERLLTSVVRLAITHGYDALTVPLVRREAGVSRRIFDANFAGVADCFLAAIEARTTEAAERAERQAAEARSWEEGVVRMAELLCTEVAGDPVLARLAFLDVFAPGRAGLECRERIVSHWAERLCHSAPAGSRPGGLAAEASAAANWRIAQTEVATGKVDRLADAAPLMAFVILAPAIGPAAAERLIAGEPPPADAADSMALSTP